MKFLQMLCLSAVLLMGCTSCEHRPVKTASKEKCASKIVERSTAGFGTCNWRLRVRVDMWFTPVEADEIGQAMLNWSKASGGRICFDIEWVSMCQDQEKRRWLGDGVTTLYAGLDAWHRPAATQGTCKPPARCSAVTIWSVTGQEPDVFYFLPRRRDYFLTLTEHELGHVLGMSHDPDKDALMNAGVGIGTHIGEADLRTLRCLMKNGKVGVHDNPCRHEDK